MMTPQEKEQLEAKAFRTAKRRLRLLHTELAGRRQDWANNTLDPSASARAVAYQSAMQSVHSIIDEIESIAAGPDHPPLVATPIISGFSPFTEGPHYESMFIKPDRGIEAVGEMHPDYGIRYIDADEPDRTFQWILVAMAWLIIVVVLGFIIADAIN